MWVGIVYKVLLFFPLVKAGVLGWKYKYSAQNYLFFYFLITATNEWVSFVRDWYNPDVKVGLQYNLYFIFCIIFFSIYLKEHFLGWIGKISLILTFLSLSYILFFTTFHGQEFDKKIGIIIIIFYILNSLLWFYQKIAFFDEYKITDDPAFWIFTALLMWSCFFLFRVTPMFYFAKEDNEFLQFLRVGQNVINVVMYLLFYIALLKFENKLKHTTYAG
ncbi:hypothetical protein OMO38_02630 [Chryseobacterium sp. 09-1422]|uniref:Uncharacterized protein n=1 Tax=Chryseobacterium kimseyorum TaxID=2984028 RepID=A0ABT3HUH2_9FLAO|nr:hypothetical protein [Chryseobacterium kimseyorum]MCW3167414.1 hypothetical protein [Chryseobacterium kimseyorum]